MTENQEPLERPLKKVDVLYFALFREERGIASETLETRAPDAHALFLELASKHGFSLPESVLRVAINDTFGEFSAPLRSGDRVAFIPPVAGG